MKEWEIQLAEKTFLAMLNPYGSVEKTFPLVLRNAREQDVIRYIGIKNRAQISAVLLKKLEARQFYLHTYDHQSYGGRAIDIKLQNPITGNFMTGSSSGTAMNVFLGINDLGIGTDGGGSVLAPALSLNLYGFISKLICEEELQAFPKGVSTDGIAFHTSLGFITRDIDTLRSAVETALDFSLSSTVIEGNRICVQHEVFAEVNALQTLAGVQRAAFPSFQAERGEQLTFLLEKLTQYDIIVGREGPIDVKGFGDTVFGHFDETTQDIQCKACKGLLKVANMAEATALVIPSTKLACGYILITRSTREAIRAMFSLAACFPLFEDELTQRYFRDLKKYIPHEFGQ